MICEDFFNIWIVRNYSFTQLLFSCPVLSSRRVSGFESFFSLLFPHPTQKKIPFNTSSNFQIPRFRSNQLTKITMATGKNNFFLFLFSLYSHTLANKNNKNKRNPLFVFVLKHLWAHESVVEKFYILEERFYWKILSFHGLLKPLYAKSAFY